MSLNLYQYRYLDLRLITITGIQVLRVLKNLQGKVSESNKRFSINQIIFTSNLSPE